MAKLRTGHFYISAIHSRCSLTAVWLIKFYMLRQHTDENEARQVAVINDLQNWGIDDLLDSTIPLQTDPKGDIALFKLSIFQQFEHL